MQLRQNKNVVAACLHGVSERLGRVFCAAVLRLAASASQSKLILLAIVLYSCRFSSYK